VLIGLNKGETLHSMARAIFFGRQVRFMDRGYEAQLNRASALSLVLNAIVVWNTRHFDRAQEKVAQLDDPVEEQVWQHLSAILWEHINLVGSYHFSDVQLEGEFRPLREVELKRTKRQNRTTTQEPALESEVQEEPLRQLSLLQEDGQE